MTTRLGLRGIEIECVVVDTEGPRRHGGGALVGVDGDDGAADVGDLWLAVVDLVERPCRSRVAEQLVEGASPTRNVVKPSGCESIVSGSAVGGDVVVSGTVGSVGSVVSTRSEP